MLPNEGLINHFFFSFCVLLASSRKPKNRRQDLEDSVGKEAIQMAKLQTSLKQYVHQVSLYLLIYTSLIFRSLYISLIWLSIWINWFGPLMLSWLSLIQA